MSKLKMEGSNHERQEFKHWIGRVKAGGIINLLIFFLTLSSTGCMHKVILDKRAFSLEGPADFAIMVPSGSPSTPDNDFQKYQIEFAGKGTPTKPLQGVNCTVKGDLFSLAPETSSNPRLWVVTSLNVHGWEHRGDSFDLESEWMRFAHEVLTLQRSGCFPKGDSPQEILRQIAEAIPVPASEQLLYSYSLGRSGFVDLVPGMQLVIERAAFRTKAGTSVPAGPADEFTERLKVVERPPSGSALRLGGSVSRGLGKTLDHEAVSPHAMLNRFAASSSLRVMVLTLRDDNTRRFPVLLGSTEPVEIWEASDKIVAGTLTECPPSSSSRLACLFFDKDSAVSVLMSVWVNGRRLYHPLGTTVGSLIGRLPESEANGALATVSMERPLVGGGYARVNFPHDAEAARQVLLLNGDRLTWRH
ncbi:MAG TPA: hypothetical protein VGG62_04850 [Terracidiphilus sp.]